MSAGAVTFVRSFVLQDEHIITSYIDPNIYYWTARRKASLLHPIPLVSIPSLLDSSVLAKPNYP